MPGKPKTVVKEKPGAALLAQNVQAIDYKDVQTLRRFISSYGKIAPQRRSGLPSKLQRKLAKAIKRARNLGLMSYVSK